MQDKQLPLQGSTGKFFLLTSTLIGSLGGRPRDEVAAIEELVRARYGGGLFCRDVFEPEDEAAYSVRQAADYLVDSSIFICRQK